MRTLKKIQQSLMLLLVVAGFTVVANGQTNMVVTNATADSILKGLYNPGAYNPVIIPRLPDSIINSIVRDIRPDSIKAYWLKLGTFYNRGTGNQLSSATQGITAAVNWANGKFQEFRNAGNKRLVVSNFTFSQNICSKSSHKEPFAILPGNSNASKALCIFTAHIDSRNETSCAASNTSARGMEDNATGTAVLLELARVMSKYSYTQSIVFLITIGEEQGLYGSKAFATYLKNKAIPVRVVQNNDMVGSIYCVLPVSQPGCAVNGGVDSINTRLFSGGGINSQHKSWVRYIKLQYNEKIKPLSGVANNITIMTDIDRVGRSGDHVSFYNLGITDSRMVSANEPGDGSGNGSTRTHTTRDIGGVDANGDGVLESYYVSFSYMARNAQINAIGVAMASDAPATPTYTVTNLGSNKLKIVINTQTGYSQYRVGIRTGTNDFDSVYTLKGLTDTLSLPVSSVGYYYVSAVSRDANKVESLFGSEVTVSGTSGAPVASQVEGSNALPEEDATYTLLQNFPNPFDEATNLTVYVKKRSDIKTGVIRVWAMDGRLVKELQISLNMGNNQIVFNHQYRNTGTLVYSLYVGGKKIATKRMVIAN